MGKVRGEGEMGTGKPAICGDCDCALAKIGTGYVPVDIGNRYATTKLLVCGEAPGEQEAREGLPFRPAAQAGSLFADACREVHISRSEMAVCNVLSCRPPRDWLEGAPYASNAIYNCSVHHLDRTIRELQPKVILALGGTAMRALIDVPKGRFGQIEVARGFVYPGKGVATGSLVIPSPHPSFLRRGAPHLTPHLQRDIRRAFLLATGKLIAGQHYALSIDSYDPQYQPRPTLDEALEWESQINPELPIIYDIETKMSSKTDEEDRTSNEPTEIKLVQFTQHRKKGIALPFRDEFVEIVRRVMLLPNVKAGHNSFAFDNPILEANGVEIKGELHDTMILYGFYWSDLPRNLQSCAQMAGFPMPWKAMGDDDLETYGCFDVDATLCVFQYMSGLLEREGMWESYRRYFAQVWPILRDMSRRGIPISNEKRMELKELITREDGRVTVAIQGVVPPEVRSNKQKNGLKRNPKLKCEECEYEGRGDHICVSDVAANTSLGTAVPYSELALRSGLVEIEVGLGEEEKCQCLKVNRGSCAICAGSGIIPAGTVVRRWAEPKEFNPNSSDQVKKLIKHLGHPVPKHSKRTDEQGEAAETTEMKELERLWQKTKHPVYPLLIEKRMLTKVDGTYVTGWAPSSDQAVHTTFTFQTATWQTSCCAAWTPVTTMRGVVPIATIGVGDYVWTHRKRWRKVTQCWVHPAQPMFEVHFGNGHVLTCTALHRLLSSEHGTQKSMAHLGEHRSGVGALSRSPMLQQTGDCATAQHNTAHNRLDHAAQDVTGRTSRSEGVALLEVEGGSQESSIRQTLTPVEGRSERWSRILDYIEGREAPVCASSGDGRGVGNSRSARDLRRSSHRSGSEEQQSGQSCVDDAGWSSDDSRDHGYEHGSVSITKIVPVGSFPVHDITVDEDESYESCGVFSHNSRSPNVQNGLKHGKTDFQKELARGFNAMQHAVEGKVLINLDFKSFHALTTAHDFNIPDYARLARIDIHSFVTCYFLKHPVRERLWGMGDQEMLSLFKELKKDETFKFTRDFKAKRAILGIQFGMGYRKLFQLNRDDFQSESEARSVWEMVYLLFPKLRRAQDEVRNRAAEEKRLVNKFGALRHFFDVVRWDRKQQKWVPGDQAEQAVAFLPASHAFGVVRTVLLAIRAKGWDEKYGLCNQIHDSLVFHCPEELAEECVRNVKGEMERPSQVLIYPEMAPDGLVVGADAAMGVSLSEMREVKG